MYPEDGGLDDYLAKKTGRVIEAVALPKRYCGSSESKKRHFPPLENDAALVASLQTLLAHFNFTKPARADRALILSYHILSPVLQLRGALSMNSCMFAKQAS